MIGKREVLDILLNEMSCPNIDNMRISRRREFEQLAFYGAKLHFPRSNSCTEFNQHN